MSRQVVELHTIAQWNQVDPSIRPLILQQVKLKERLWGFLQEQIRKPTLKEAKWVRCSKCWDSPYPGYILIEPRYDGLHPSQIGQPCLLRTYNQMIGAAGQKKIEPRQQLIFDIGHAVHHMFQTYGVHGAWGTRHYKAEVQISPEHQQLADLLMIEGHIDAENILIIDGIPNAPIYELRVVHEYKTANSNNFAKLKKPKPEHIQQAMLYAAALDAPVVAYLYLNKDDSNLVDFPVEFNRDVWQVIEQKALLLRQCYDRGEAPPAEVGFHCKDCDFVYNCGPYRMRQINVRGGNR